MNKRLNNFEALRIVAMFMVIVLHYLYKGRLLISAGEAFNGISYVAWLVEAFSIVAVNVYVLITGYFMCESSMKVSRLLQIVCQVLWYTILIPITLFALGIVCPSDLDMYDLLRFVFPVHMKHYWFVTAYVILLLFVPFLNIAVKQMTQKQLLLTTTMMTIYQTLPKSILPVAFTDDEAGNNVLWLVCLYLIAAYIRKYGIPFFSSLKKSLICYVVGVFVIYGSMLFMRQVYFRLDALSEGINFAYHYNHLFCLWTAVSLFYVFKHWDFKDSALSRLVGWAAPYTFGVYLIHEQMLVRDLWPSWLNTAPTENVALFLWGLIWRVSAVLVIGIILDWIRAMIFRQLGRLLDKTPVMRTIKKLDEILRS